MKKENKKYKIIWFVAVILLVAILAIVITTSITRNNSQLSNEGYGATTATAGSSLISNYILNGITIGGITGKMDVLDTSDATATAEDIAYGKTAYIDGEKIIGTRIDTVAQAKESQYVFLENKILIDDYGNNIKVPEGFKIAEDSATSVTGGVVIEDVSAKGTTSETKGSQFVWIPVEDVYTRSEHTEENKKIITLGRYTFDSNGTEHIVQSAEKWSDTSNNIAINTYFKELATSGYGNATAKNLEEFITKAITSGGYYIGRYEAGDATGSARTGTNNTSNPNNPITCKAGVYPYTYIDQPDASTLCRNMYNSSNFEGDIINSYAWDTAIVFIQTYSGDTDYSRQIRLQSTLARCGEATDGTSKDVRCNIYDMAGNTCEWSTETSSYANYPCVNRGGSCIYTDRYASYHFYNIITGSSNFTSTRPILYL